MPACVQRLPPRANAWRAETPRPTKPGMVERKKAPGGVGMSGLSETPVEVVETPRSCIMSFSCRFAVGAGAEVGVRDLVDGQDEQGEGAMAVAAHVGHEQVLGDAPVTVGHSHHHLHEGGHVVREVMGGPLEPVVAVLRVLPEVRGQDAGEDEDEVEGITARTADGLVDHVDEESVVAGCPSLDHERDAIADLSGTEHGQAFFRLGTHVKQMARCHRRSMDVPQPLQETTSSDPRRSELWWGVSTRTVRGLSRSYSTTPNMAVT